MSDSRLAKMPLFSEVYRFFRADLDATRSADDLADYGLSILRRYGITMDYLFHLLDIFDQLEDGPAPEPPPGPEPVKSHRPEKPPKRRPKPALSDPPKTALSLNSRSWQMWKDAFPSAAGGERK